MRLASHLVVSESDDIKDGTVGCEESVERESKVWFLDLLGEVGQIESVIV